MHNTIRYRAMLPTDKKPLEKIIRDTWGYETFCSPKSAQRMSALYLQSCLANQTFLCVAENNGEPVGIIMGKNEKTHRPALRHTMRMCAAALALLSTKEGRRVLNMFSAIERMDQKLLAKCDQPFDGELAFFAVRSDQRGTGIGKELFRRLMDTMKAQKIERFFLYTDSTCNYGFYEHQGMQRVQQEAFSLKPYQDKEILFYLYESSCH